MSQRISRRTALIGVAVTVALVVVLALVLVLNRDDSMPTSGTPTPAATTPSFDPSATPTPSKTSATPGPTSTGPTSTTRPKKQTAAIGDSADLGGGTTAVVATVKAVKGKAELPGEVGGPAISLVLKVTAGKKAIDFDETVVNAYYGGDDTPAVALTTGTEALTGTLAAGRSASGTYIFSVPTNQLRRVAVELDLALAAPVTVFRGSVD